MAQTRAAALAVCLMALAAGASAACSGYLKLDLISASTAAAGQSEIARCLTSMQVDFSSTCQAQITPLIGASGNYVQGMWVGGTTDSTLAYPVYTECPTTQRDVTAVSSPSGATSLEAALENAIYGAKKPIAVTSVTFNAEGTITVVLGSGGNLIYAITKSTASPITDINANATVPVACGSTLTAGDNSTAGTKCLDNTNDQGLATRCGPASDGRYGIVVDSNLVKICALCPAGTVGDGYTCSPCEGGKTNAGVGSDTCDNCNAGTYGPAGISTGAANKCLPCPANTYSLTGNETCTECPFDSYSWIPGATACVRCVAGIPSTCTHTSCTTNGTAVYAGSHIAEPTAALTAAGCDLATSSSDPYYVPVVEKGCVTTALRFAFEVEGDCSITIYPIALQNENCTDPTKDGFGDNVMTAYYHWDASTPAFVIRSLLDTPSLGGSRVSDGTGDSGYIVNYDGTTMAWWAATTKADTNTTGVAPITSGGCQVAVTGPGLVSATPATSCPAGSYNLTDNGLSTGNTQYCWKCPTGSYCGAGSTSPTSCDADYYNPYLGQDAIGDCITCNSTNTLFTSYPGAAICSVEWYNMECNFTSVNRAAYYDASSQSCIDCPAGTFRNDTTETCDACAAGTYSVPGASQTVAGSGACVNCPIGQYNPSTGFGESNSTTNGLKCMLCPVGSIPQTSSSALANYTAASPVASGATVCVPCPKGTFQSGSSANGSDWKCEVCPPYSYRQGDASPTNNKCLAIPAGYRLTETAKRAELSLCDNGTVSWWEGTIPSVGNATFNNTRVPRGNDIYEATCIHCAANVTGQLVPSTWGHTYAPRKGMTQCIPCPAGQIPVTTTDGTGVNTPASSITGARTSTCTPCGSGTYRTASMVGLDGITCSTNCLAGRETGPSGRTACTLCRPGYVSAASLSDTCTACAVNNYRATPGGTACTLCPKGTDTQGEGNVECSPCPEGYYNGKPGLSCQAAPAGTQVNKTGAWFPTPCPKGTWNDETGLDTCNPCPPGKYASTLGSQSCKTCPAGTFATGRAATCTDCRAGYFASPGSPICSACRPGFYAPVAKSAFCIPCKKGFQCPTSALKETVGCPAGTYSNKEGNRMCTPCPVNTISTAGTSTTAVTSCTKCPLGTSTRGLTGQTVCTTYRPQTRRLLFA